jgi:hypothetical protein
MTDRSRTSASAIIRRTLVLTLALALVGCGLFKPKEKKEDPPVPFQYPPLDTPQNVLLNLKYSWERRDSVQTRLLYDDAYQGESTDNQSGGTTLTFSKDQEVATVWSLGKSQDVQSVAFTLRPETTWVRLNYPTDPAGWTALQLQGVNIQVDDASKGTLIANSSNFFEFKFVPTLDAASATDTTWKIVRWKEIRN